MAVWAHPCQRCGEPDTVYFVARDAVAEFPPDTMIVQVKVGDRWLCSRLDRSRAVEVEGMLVRQAVATPARDCGDCEDA